jgi:allantoinase
MPAHDLQIRNGRILRNGELVDVDLSIDSGKISAIEKAASRGAAHSIDAHGLILLPGLIDPHVHFRDPGQTHKEDFLSGTRGAVAGGTTTVFDMPNTDPPVTTPEIFREKAKTVQQKTVANFGLIAGASHENLSRVTELAKVGAVAFKTYMISPPKEREREYAGTFVTTSGELLQTMRQVAITGLVHCVHAEASSSVSLLTEELKQQKRTDPMAHYDSRPNFTEEEALSDALILSEFLRSKIHIVHVSTSQSVRLLAEAKKRGINVTSETCPQYMLFSKEILNTKGPDAKINPPPRNPEDKDRMIAALASGDVEMISTDHAPHTEAEKNAGLKDIFKAPSGTPGVETRLPLLLNFVHQGRLALKDLPEITSTSAAKRFGIYPRKGSIEVGADADLAIIDFDHVWKIRASDLQTKAWETVLYDGMEVRGRAKYTIVNGQIAYEDPNSFASPGSGQMIRPWLP